jgi:TolA-binding protein
MFRLSSQRATKLLALICGGFLLAFTLSTAMAGGENVESRDNSENSAPETLIDVGLALDWSVLRSPAEFDDGLQQLETSIQTLLDGDLTSREKSAARYLSAEIKLALGKGREAEELFKKSEKDYKKGPFADDAAFLRIIAIETDGRDGDAAREWAKWMKKYADSPLMSEALIARCWNEIRRDSLRLASTTLSEFKSGYPYATDDSRVRLATATIAYLHNDPAAALESLGGQASSAAEYYLGGLCYEASDKKLKAAAQYQKVFEKYPQSPLRDHAMLAKANVFLASGGYQSAAEEYARVIDAVANEDVRAEARVRRAACYFLSGDAEASTDLLREVVQLYPGKIFAARAQLLLGEVLHSRGMYEEAVVEYNRVLTDYFEHELAASAQYRVGRCLDALARRVEATTAYQLVVSGYPISPQAPAAAYLAGAGLLEQDRPLEAAPYFQLVLDRYASEEEQGTLDFATPERQELVEAALCLLELSYHRGGDMGQLSGVPHLMLQRMPPSRSTWRAFALLIDADALAAQGRHEEAQAVLQTLIDDFPEHDVTLPANRLLAWTYAQEGKDDLAIQIEERMLARFAAADAQQELSSAYLNKAHILFNNKKYKKAAVAYDDFFQRYPSSPDRLLALYQAGLCYYRLQQSGDAVDRWEALVEADSTSDISERAWVRAGDLYFQAEYYDDAKRCYQGLLANFANSRAAALGMLRLAQCEFNAGNDSAALQLYSEVIARFPGTGIARQAEKGMEVALYRLGQSEEGGQVLADLVEQYPSSAFAADAQFEIAMRHYEERDFEAAAEEFRRVVSQFPSYSAADRAHFLMADSYTQAGKMSEAKNGYQQFLMFFPESEFEPTVRFKLGTIRFADGEYMQAAVEFSSVLEVEAPDEIKRASLFNLALCQKTIGNVGEARTALESYIEKYPGDAQIADASYQLGDILENAGDWEAAAARYEKALAAKPSRELKVELYYRLGICREELGDVDAAIGFYEKAAKSKIKSDAFRLSAVVRCAALYEQKGEYGKAITAYRDLVNNAQDGELVAAAQERVTQLEAIVK